MPRPEKVAVVDELTDKLKRSQVAVVTDYRGLNVQAITELRAQLREAGVEYRVSKNTLTRLAAKNAGIDNMDDLLKGPTAIAFDYDDPVAPAKVLSAFAKQHEDLEIKGGVLNGAIIDANEVQRLANLPAREQLLAQVLAGMQSPIAGFVQVLNGTLRSLVYAVDAIRQQKEQAG